MKKFLRGLALTFALLMMMSMSVFAATDYVPSTELPGDDENIPSTEDPNGSKKDDLPKDEYQSPKTGDDRAVLYAMAMTAIAAAGTIVIAKKKEA